MAGNCWQCLRQQQSGSQPKLRNDSLLYMIICRNTESLADSQGSLGRDGMSVTLCFCRSNSTSRPNQMQFMQHLILLQLMLGHYCRKAKATNACI